MSRKKRSKEKGFSSISFIILIIVFIGLIIGGYLLRHRQDEGFKIKQSSSALVPSPSVNRISYTQIPPDWKTFSLNNANISFKYPTGWSVVSTGDAYDPSFGPNMPIDNNGENYIRILSGRNFSLNVLYNTTRDSTNKLIIPQTLQEMVNKIYPVIVNNHQAYIAVVSQQTGYYQISLTDTLPKIGETSFKDCINITRANVCIYGGFGTQSAVQTPYNQFISDVDVNNALLIMSSLKY